MGEAITPIQSDIQPNTPDVDDNDLQIYGINLNNPDCLIPIDVTIFERGPFSGESYQKILDAFEGIGRGDKYDKDLDGTIKIMSLAEMLSKRVAGRHNKNVILILFGDLGSGKSMMLLKLALSCAMWLAAIKGGKPSDYFRFDHIAVIDPEMLQEKLANLIQYGIYILDDAGPGYDARTFMSKGNRDLNYILQTCRTSNNIILVSAPHGAMLDVTIHRVAQYYAEVSEIRHDEGLTFLKIFKLIRAFREGKILYTYMTKGNTVAKRHYCGLPPTSLKKRYDIERDRQAKIIAQRRQEREAAERAKEDAKASKESRRSEREEEHERQEVEKAARQEARDRKKQEEQELKIKRQAEFEKREAEREHIILSKIKENSSISTSALRGLAKCSDSYIVSVAEKNGIERVLDGKKTTWKSKKND